MTTAKPIPFPHKQYGTWYIEEDFRDAAYRGDLKRLQNIIKQYPTLNINAANEYGETALYIACKKNQDKVADYLLQQPGIDPNCTTILGNSPALIAAWNDDTQMVTRLAEAGADVNARTNSDRKYHGNVSILDIAQERGNTELVNLLQPDIAADNRPTP